MLVSLTLVLRRNAGDLAAQVLENADRPASERQFLSSPDLKVDDRSVQIVRAFARDYGLTVVQVDPERATVDLTGSARDVDGAFGTSLGIYGYEGKEYLGRQGSLTVPEDVAPYIQAVLGLSTFPSARPRS
jgi:kumamolisin